MEKLWQEPDADVKSLKSLLLFGLRGMGGLCVPRPRAGGIPTRKWTGSFIGGCLPLARTVGTEELLPLVMETGRVNLKCMELLDRAKYGDLRHAAAHDRPAQPSKKGRSSWFPATTCTTSTRCWSRQRGRGSTSYTHGEMLPAHAYPKLKAYPHLKGNFGTAWQNQQKEFANIPAPVLFTTNCLMPPKESYAGRVFTTEVVALSGHGAHRGGARFYPGH